MTQEIYNIVHLCLDVLHRFMTILGDETVTRQIMVQLLDSVRMMNNFNFRYENVTEHCKIFRGAFSFFGTGVSLQRFSYVAED
jgi:hypothetical protein